MSDTFTIQGYDTKPFGTKIVQYNEMYGEGVEYMHIETQRVTFRKAKRGEQKCFIRIGNDEVMISNHDLYKAWHFAEYGD